MNCEAPVSRTTNEQIGQQINGESMFVIKKIVLKVVLCGGVRGILWVHDWV